MNRILIPLALVVLVAGCSMPGLFGQQSSEPAAADTERTVVVREIYREPPVVYVDTVYMATEPAPVQPVYVNEEYNEYNEYNETYVYVHEHVVVHPPPPHHRGRGWRSREHESRPRDRGRDDESGRGRNRPRDPDKPRDVKPQYPVRKVTAPVVNDRQESPVPPPQPTPPKRRAPVLDGSVQVTQVENEAPKLAPTPSVGKPAASGEAQVSLAKPVRK